MATCHFTVAIKCLIDSDSKKNSPHRMQSTSCRTVVNTKDYINTWVIENYSTIKNQKLTSIEFSGTNQQGTWLTWSFEYEPVENSLVRRTLAQINIRSKNESVKQNCQIECVIGEKLSYLSDTLSDVTGPKILGNFNIVHTDIDRIIECSRSDSVQLRFKVTFIAHGLESGSTVQLPKLPQSTLADNFAEMLTRKQFTDITITVGCQSFRAHKAILAARSKVFAAMFQHDMRESQQNELKITDVESRVFEQILRYIYTDKVDGLPWMAHELLAAADKYDLARLKVMCEVQLFEGISAESATKTLLFADLHGANELKTRTVEFIARNLKAVSNWEEFCRARPDLVGEILKKASSNI